MISPFSNSRLPELWFGIGTIARLPEALQGFKSGVLLVTGQASHRHTLSLHSQIEFLKMSGVISWHETIATEPAAPMIDDIVARLYTEQVKAVVAIGGGSALDAGKALAAMLTTGGGVERFLEEVGTETHPGTRLPLIMAPTTAGTGSEATKNAVISKTGIGGYKRSLRHSNFIPDLALIDPELSFACTPAQTAANGMDAFSQLIEAFTSLKATPFTDALAFEGIKLVRNHLTEVVNHPDNAAARASMAYAAYLSGVALANAGLGTVHGFASELGALTDIPHGTVCGSLMAETNKITIRKLIATDTNKEALHKYARIGRLFFATKPRTKPIMPKRSLMC